MSCAFIPRYLLQRLVAVSDDDHVCHSGRRTLAVDKERRLATTPESRPAPAGQHVSGGVVTRTVHSANHTEQLPGHPVRTDQDGPVGDTAVDALFDHAGGLLEMANQVFARTSFDDRGSPLEITVHYGSHYDNAFWDGRRFCFGDGDGDIFTGFARADVAAHAFGHAVIGSTIALSDRGEPGALGESIADVFASVYVQWRAGQTVDQADWLIGAGLFSADVAATALRSMADPGTGYDDPVIGSDPQVAAMIDFVRTSDDDSGVHTNSGIPNRAFVLAARAVGGHSWDVVAPLWYATLTDGRLGPDTDFATFARACVDSARQRHADRPEIEKAVAAAWSEVGVLPSAAAEAPPSSPSSSSAETPARVVVRRSGGIAGTTRQAELDLNDDRRGPEIRRLLARADLQDRPAADRQPATRSQPDRFVYTVEYAGVQVTVGEQDLGPDLGQVVKIVMDVASRPA